MHRSFDVTLVKCKVCQVGDFKKGTQSCKLRILACALGYNWKMFIKGMLLYDLGCYPKFLEIVLFLES